MQSISSLIKKLKADFPDINYEESDIFAWSPNSMTIFYEAKGNPCLLIHELSHALLGHKAYARDVELMKMETEAWEKTKELSQKYSVKLGEDFIQNNLDTYRDWLHKRSICPDCSSNGIQIKQNTYSCLVCESEWTVNESRINNLRRYKTK